MRVLFTANPLLGHLLPLVPLARAALAEGHEVVIASGPDLVNQIERRGFRSWSIGPPLAEIEAGVRARPQSEDESEFERLAGQGTAMFGRPAVARALDLRRLTADWVPDLVVSEVYELGGAYASGRLRVLHGLGAHFPGFVPLARTAAGAVLDALGEPPVVVDLADIPYLDPWPEALQPPGDRPFSEVLPLRPHAGEVLDGERLPAAFERLLAAPSVYLTLGTVFNDPATFRDPLLALAELDVNVVVTCGLDLAAASMSDLPANVAVAPFVPQALLLPRVSAVVSHAGAGTLVGGLLHGLPQVCLPQGADQFVNAEQVARVGAAVVLLPDQVTPEAIRDATRQVLTDPSYAAAARAMSTELAAMPSAAEVLTALLQRSR